MASIHFTTQHITKHEFHCINIIFILALSHIYFQFSLDNVQHSLCFITCYNKYVMLSFGIAFKLHISVSHYWF
jgi:hypothetical protein